MASIALPVIGWLVSPVISKVIDHGILHFKEKWKLEEGVPEEIDRLNKTLPLIRGVLEDAEMKQLENKGVLSWLGELKEVLYDAEDVLDAYEADLALTVTAEKRGGEPQLPTAMGWKAKVRGHFSSCLCCRKESHVDISVVAKQLKSIREKLDDICERGQRLGLQQMAISASAPENNTRGLKNRVTAPFLEESVVGRENEKRSIIKMLLDDLNDSGKKLLVVPIVGMGGVGKTTLARLVYNDDKMEAFKSKAWVCIGMSRDLDLESLMKKIINSVATPQTRGMNYEHFTPATLLRTFVEEIVDKQPFLMVVDDAWDSKPSSWKEFLKLFKASGLVCRIIVTTREKEVADAIRSDRLEPFPVKTLERKDMWDILRSHAFPSGTADIDPELEFIGRRIVERLKGLPLAAEIIGGVLYGSTDARYWRRISESKLLEINEKENNMLPILMLSYDNLSAVLKQCFPYFSLFPKDYTFVLGPERYTYIYSVAPARRISNLWMSHRLTNVEKGMTLEDTGSEIITQLSNRSLLHGIEIRSQPSVTIHDLVHDLAEKITNKEFLCVSSATGNINLPMKLRHISFIQENPNKEEVSELELKMLGDMKKCQTLRTLLLYKFNKKFSDYTSLLDGCFNSLIYLRALSLHNEYMTSLPDSIGNLKLLRYLDLRLPLMEKLPESVSGLHNLQVLVLSCVRLSALNDSLTALVNLVRLDHGSVKTLKSIGKLTNLQQLEEFQVDRLEGYKMKELQNLNKICGSLHIRNLENIETKEEAREAKLDNKEDLTELKFDWGNTNDQEEEVQSDVLEGLCPNKNLEKLSLSRYMGKHLPTWFLPSLKDIKLYKCLKLQVIPTLTDGLQRLEVVDSPQLKEMPSLPPRLQHLHLSHVGVTSLIPSSSSSSQPPPSVPRLTSLKTLYVDGCPHLDESLSVLLKGSLPSLDSLYISDYSCPLGAIRSLTALSKLVLRSCTDVTAFPALSSLRELEIRDCPNFTFSELPSTPFPSLLDLLLVGIKLEQLTHLMVRVAGGPLRYLHIEGCNDLTSFEGDLERSFLSLASLRRLAIYGCDHVQQLPSNLRELKALPPSSCPPSWRPRPTAPPPPRLQRRLRYTPGVASASLAFAQPPPPPLSSNSPAPFLVGNSPAPPLASASARPVEAKPPLRLHLAGRRSVHSASGRPA